MVFVVFCELLLGFRLIFLVYILLVGGWIKNNNLGVSVEVGDLSSKY